MKVFFQNYKIPIILGSIALVTIIATLIIILGDNSSDYGLYITSAYGSVSITNSEQVKNPSNGNTLENGDIITVGSNSSCTLVYKGKKKSEQNYIVLADDTQLVVTSEFDGKDDKELFLRNGSVIANFAEKDRSEIKIRTADSLITTANSVSKISYYTNEFMSYTDLYTFMNDSKIQLYDSHGYAVNNAELQMQKKWGRIVSEDGPSFEALNLDIDLNELSAFDLKTLISIATYIGEDFPYTVDELRAVYNTKSDDSDGISIEEPFTEPTDTSVTTEIDNSDAIQTAEPIVSTTPPPTETTLPHQTTTAASTTTTVQTTTTEASVVYHVVTIVIDGEETIQEVIHGGDAVQPEDPKIDGMVFLGWDNSFKNITEDIIITALFDESFIDDTNDNNDDSSTSLLHKVTVVVGNKSTTINVKHGESANLPSTLNIDGYVFMGWDKDFTRITEDITITAILSKNTHTVTFIVENEKYTVEVAHDGTAIPPHIPSKDSNGNNFIGWDKSITNIIVDTTITAVFDTGNYHTVTFIIDNEFYMVRVPHGGTAEPPFWPVKNSNGLLFWRWDHSLENITEDVTISAYFIQNKDPS